MLKTPIELPKRKRYPTDLTDLTDREWAILEPLAPAVKPGGRPATRARREIVNAILYVLRGGNPWDAMVRWQAERQVRRCSDGLFVSVQRLSWNARLSGLVHDGDGRRTVEAS